MFSGAPGVLPGVASAPEPAPQSRPGADVEHSHLDASIDADEKGATG
jgi:hypothetical protein